MSDVVKECSPGGGARPSNPQAAIVSIYAFPCLGATVAAALAAAQQSKIMRTSDFPLSNRP